jgi:proline iminopeptidase
MSESHPYSALYPPLEPYRTGRLQVDAVHSLYWEECGNPNGQPVLVLHGGPGAGCSPQHRQFFNPNDYRIVLFDQRGAGRSTPLGEIRDNTTAHLIQDIEQLRQQLDIPKWLVFGGSWGSTLALAYGQAHAARCQGFVLRGIYFGSQAEVDWFLNGMRWFFPVAHARFVEGLSSTEMADLLTTYEMRLNSQDPAISTPAARRWSRYEGSCLHLLPHPEVADEFESDAIALGLARIEAHYFRHCAFLQPNQLLTCASQLHHLPAIIVQGRYDVVCPPASAYQLHQAWPQARLQIIEDAGHSAFEPGIASALVAATDRFIAEGCFG